MSIGGHSYNVWYGTQSVWDTVTYEMTSGTYDGNIPAGGTATVGFTASYTGSNSAPASVSCS